MSLVKHQINKPSFPIKTLALFWQINFPFSHHSQIGSPNAVCNNSNVNTLTICCTIRAQSELSMEIRSDVH